MDRGVVVVRGDGEFDCLTFRGVQRCAGEISVVEQIAAQAQCEVSLRNDGFVLAVVLAIEQVDEVGTAVQEQRVP